MSSRNRAAAVRSAAAKLSTELKTNITATYASGAHWDWQWVDGPSTKILLAKASRVDLAGAAITPRRLLSKRAIALAALRLVATGDRADGYRLTSWQVEDHLHDVDYPDKTANPREEAMLTKLLAQAPKDQYGYIDDRSVVDEISKSGIGWLLSPSESDGTATASPPLSPIEILTARYATTGDARIAWQRHGTPMPASDAVNSALNDESLDQPTALAVLAVLAQMRLDHARLEQAAIEAAQRLGVTWTQIGDAVGNDEHAVREWTPTTLNSAAR
jgi:hypothetical protein